MIKWKLLIQTYIDELDKTYNHPILNHISWDKQLQIYLKENMQSKQNCTDKIAYT